MNAFSVDSVTFYDAVNMIHDVITTARFMFVGVRNNNTQQIKRRKINRIRR